MPRVAKGHIEQLPSGSFRVSVYAGIDPLTRRAIRLKSTVKTEQLAQIELARLLKEASAGRTPKSGATVAKLMDEYAAVAEWDVCTRQTNEGFIGRTIKPALGPIKVRKVRGPILDKLYAELERCGDLSCTGRPFIAHRNVPVLTINPRDRRPAWQQVTATLTEAIRSGTLVPGDELPSITELNALQGIGTGVVRHALEALAADGLIIVRHGRRRWLAIDPDTRASGRHYTASQLLADGFDLRNTAAARLGHSGGGASALRRPGPRRVHASRRLPRTVDRRVYPVIPSDLTVAVRHGCVERDGGVRSARVRVR